MKVYQTLQKKKHSQNQGEKKEQEERTNIELKDNAQKHKTPNGGHRKEQWEWGQTNNLFLNFSLVT